MTISSTANRISYTGNGATTAFSFPYAVLAAADLVVLSIVTATGVQTTKTLTTDYTVSVAGDKASATVTFLTAPASTETIVIYRDPAQTQATDFVDNSPLPAASIEDGLDKLTMIAQRSRDLVGRSLRQPDGDTADIDVLPAKVSRASKYLAFDADGDPVATSGTTSDVVVSTFMETVLDDADAATALTTLGAASSTEAALLAAAQTFTAGQRGEVTALTDAASIALDLSLSNNFSVTLAGNRTLANPTNAVAGQSGVIAVTQDGTGSRTLAYGTSYVFRGGTEPVLTTTAAAVDLLFYYVISATSIFISSALDVKT